MSDNEARAPRPTLTAYIPFIAGLIVLVVGVYIAWSSYTDYARSSASRESDFQHLREKNRRILEDHTKALRQEHP